MNELTQVERIAATREAGAVKRCHAIPHVGEYNVATHCYNAVSMLMVLHPNPSVDMIKALLWHDGAERWVGDLPSPAKKWSEALRAGYDEAQLNAIQHWEMYEGFEGLCDDDYLWLNAIDALELWVWTHDQIAFGNRHCERTLLYSTEAIKHSLHRFPRPCKDFFESYEWSRLPEQR